MTECPFAQANCETAFIGPKDGKLDMEELFDAAGVRYELT